LKGDVAGKVATLKSETNGDILKYGTGELDRTLLDHGLLDELHLWIFPVIAGKGQRLMNGLIDTTHFGLADTTVFESGIVVHVLTPRDQPEG
jgi:dihydrofolate reductase